MTPAELEVFNKLAEEVKAVERENVNKVSLGRGFGEASDIVFRANRSINFDGPEKAFSLTDKQIAHIKRGINEARYRIKRG